MGLFVLVVFWVGACVAFPTLGTRSAVTFIALWIGGIVLCAACHLQPFFFIAYEALLSAVLFVMLQHEWV
jgi:hypothetical protein